MLNAGSHIDAWESPNSRRVFVAVLSPNAQVVPAVVGSALIAGVNAMHGPGIIVAVSSFAACVNVGVDVRTFGPCFKFEDAST
jgi:hypothetical protein